MFVFIVQLCFWEICWHGFIAFGQSLGQQPTFCVISCGQEPSTSYAYLFILGSLSAGRRHPAFSFPFKTHVNWQKAPNVDIASMMNLSHSNMQALDFLFS